MSFGDGGEFLLSLVSGELLDAEGEAHIVLQSLLPFLWEMSRCLLAHCKYLFSHFDQVAGIEVVGQRTKALPILEADRCAR